MPTPEQWAKAVREHFDASDHYLFVSFDDYKEKIVASQRCDKATNEMRKLLNEYEKETQCPTH